MALLRVLFAACMLGAVVASEPAAVPLQLGAGWTHGWDTALAAQAIDFGYSQLTPAQARDVASHYGLVSLEKCSSPHDTEAAIWASAALLKAAKPSIKVMFYLATDLGGLQCYAALHTYLAHPDWWLRDDAGALVNSSSHIPLPDYTVAAMRDFWVAIPLNGTSGSASPFAGLIDGVLADGTGSPCLRLRANISPARCAALAAGKAEMITALQAVFTATNGGVVMQVRGVVLAAGVCAAHWWWRQFTMQLVLPAARERSAHLSRRRSQARTAHLRAFPCLAPAEWHRHVPRQRGSRAPVAALLQRLPSGALCGL